jgi:hypothetical protein
MKTGCTSDNLPAPMSEEQQDRGGGEMLLFFCILLGNRSPIYQPMNDHDLEFCSDTCGSDI